MSLRNLQEFLELIGETEIETFDDVKYLHRHDHNRLVSRLKAKEEKKKAQMLSELVVGDIVLTTSGFYGTVIDIQDDTVIVEFGNNRNCRIPMQKGAIAVVEKPEEA